MEMLVENVLTRLEENIEDDLTENQIFEEMETEGEFVNRHTIGREVTLREIGLLRERYHKAYATGRMLEG